MKSLKKIGILGGTFDPPHKGHLLIAKFAINKLNLSFLFWAVTKQNPLKKKTYLTLKKRIFLSKKIVKKVKKVKVKSFDHLIKSSKTISLIKYIKKNNKTAKIFFIMGSDNVLNFHKWNNWKKISQLCQIVVFSRKGYDKKAQKSPIIKHLKGESIIFIKNKKIDISSTKLRKYYRNKNI